MSDPANSGAERADYATRFKPGNPGKPKGARHHIEENFLKDVLAAWKASGKKAITDMIADKPGDFVKMVASLLPKDVNLNVNDDREMTDDELVERIRSLTATLAPLLVDRTGGDAVALEAQAISDKPPIVH